MKEKRLRPKLLTGVEWMQVLDRVIQAAGLKVFQRVVKQ
jgi:hypothetical protein